MEILIYLIILTTIFMLIVIAITEIWTEISARNISMAFATQRYWTRFWTIVAVMATILGIIILKTDILLTVFDIFWRQ